MKSRYRSSESGRFVHSKENEAYPATTVKETIKRNYANAMRKAKQRLKEINAMLVTLEKSM